MPGGEDAKQKGREVADQGGAGGWKETLSVISSLTMTPAPPPAQATRGLAWEAEPLAEVR